MIIYSLIARGSLVLVEYTDHDGDFPQLVRKILIAAKKTETKQVLQKDQYVFCILTYQDFRFICMMTAQTSKEKGFLFLEALKQEYLRAIEDSNYTNARFTQVLSQLMKGFTKLNDRDALGDLESTVDELNEQASQNLKKMIERETDLDLLVQKTNELSQTSDFVYYQSKKMRAKLRENEFRIGCKVFLFGVASMLCGGIYLYLTL